MSIELYDRLMAGGSNVSWIFHVGGFPYALASDQKVIDALASDTANRRIMFGKANDGLYHPVDSAADFPIFNALQADKLGIQTIGICEEKGELEGGAWSASVARTEPGFSWIHRTGDIWGFEGIHTQPSPDYDNEICSAHLNEAYTTRSNVADLKVDHDLGGRMKTAIDAAEAAQTYKYLWIGTECIAVSSCTLAAGVLSIVVMIRGCFRSPIQRFFLSQANESNIFVSDVPLGGAAGRPGCLWAVPMSDDGTEISGSPALVRQGKILPRVETRNNLTKINIDPWWKWLNTHIEEAKTARLKGYTFNRVLPPAGMFFEYDRQPAMRLWEVDHTGVWDWADVRNVYICPKPGAADGVTTVRFETSDELFQALNKELALCSQVGVGVTTDTVGGNGSDGVAYNYLVGSSGMRNTNNVANAMEFTLLDGFLPWLLDLGYIFSGDTTIEDDFKRNYQWFTSLDRGVDGDNDFGENPGYRVVINNRNDMKKYMVSYVRHTGEEHESRIAKYAYQYRWDPDTVAGMGKVKIREWPVPVDPDTNVKIYIQPSDGVDVNQWPVDDDVIIGDSNIAHAARVEAIDEDAATIQCDDAGHVFPLTIYPAFESLHTDLTLRRGDFLTYVPAYHEVDPWPVSLEAIKIEADQGWHAIVKILRGIFGASEAVHLGHRVKCPDWIQVLNIPGAVSDSGLNADFAPVFDWEQMSDKMQEKNLDLNVEFLLSNKLKLLEVIINELRFHGLGLTHFYDETSKQFMIGVKDIGIINFTDAWNSGRLITVKNRELYTAPTIERHSAEKLISRVKVSFDYGIEEGKDKFLENFDFTDRTGDALTNRVDSTTKIKSWFLHPDEKPFKGTASFEEILNHFAILTNRMALPQSEIEVDLSIPTALILAVGEAVLVTDPTICNPFTGQLGLDGMGGVLAKLKTDWSKGKAKGTIRLGPFPSYGWAPSMQLTAETHSIASATILNVTLTDDEDHIFTSSKDRIDLSFFDCMNWNRSSGAYTARDCSCGEYLVYVFEKDNDDPTVYELRVRFFDYTLDSGDANYRNFQLIGAHVGWDLGKTYIVEFPKWSDALIQPCQRHYVYAANAAHRLVDSAAATTDGRKWG